MEHPADSYRDCESGRCNHDLARAVGIAELWASDGPFVPSHLVLTLPPPGPVLFDDDEAPALQQRWAV